MQQLSFLARILDTKTGLRVSSLAYRPLNYIKNSLKQRHSNAERGRCDKKADYRVGRPIFTFGLPVR
jgi:hypothetical protein